jgi:hypothetical protein
MSGRIRNRSAVSLFHPEMPTIPRLLEAAKAGATASSCIGRLMLGPSTSASPQKHMAQSGSSLLRLAEGALRLAVIERISEPEPRTEIRLRQLIRRCDPSDLDPPEANST